MEDPIVADSECIVPELAPFVHDSLITDVLRRLKTGKEATVYCCRAHPSTGVDLLAAKVFRPRDRRSFRNDTVYQEGRTVTDSRLRRAIRNHTPTGRELAFDMWVEREYDLLGILYDAGADVPAPVDRSGRALLMEFVGDESTAAPLLRHVDLDRDEAEAIFRRIVWNIEVMLDHEWIHADLSPFNILYWQGEIRIIDFPQAVDPFANPHARNLLGRDVENVCRYFRRCGIEADADRISENLWTRFMNHDIIGERR